jgi:hypothetical protein
MVVSFQKMHSQHVLDTSYNYLIVSKQKKEQNRTEQHSTAQQKYGS